MEFQNIDMDFDFEISLFVILMPILILKFFCISILEKMDQYFFAFSLNFYRVIINKPNKTDREQTLPASACHIGWPHSVQIQESS